MITTNTDRKLHTLDQIKRAAYGAGSHWFDRSAMRYFNSRIGERVHPVPGGALFVSSEQFDWNSPRLYSVRSCTFEGSIDTVGEFQQYATNSAAHAAASSLVKSGFSLHPTTKA
jgi:hypothetical protein